MATRDYISNQNSKEEFRDARRTVFECLAFQKKNAVIESHLKKATDGRERNVFDNYQREAPFANQVSDSEGEGEESAGEAPVEAPVADGGVVNDGPAAPSGGDAPAPAQVVEVRPSELVGTKRV